jgi:hypothetical protein
LEPLVQLAGVRSRRAFVTGAVAVGVSRDGTAVLVKPYRQDVRRPDIFDEISDEAQVLSDPTDDAIAVAVRAAIQIARDSQV